MKPLNDIPLTQAEALQLMERYFEAQTSEQEEEALKRFAASPLADSPAFEPLRATLAMAAYATGRAGFQPACAGKASFHPAYAGKASFQPALPQPKNRKHRPTLLLAPLRYAALWAAVVLLGVAVYHYADQPDEACIAYINGTRTTSSEAVMQAMLQSVKAVGEPEGVDNMEQLMNDMLTTPGAADYTTDCFTP